MAKKGPSRSLWAFITGQQPVLASVGTPLRSAVVVADLFEEAQSAAAMLRKLGFEATLLVGGEAGLTGLQGRAVPDLVFLDCWESRLDGLALLQVVAHYHPELPERVVARVPGGAGSAIGNELVALGVRAVVPERMTPESLAEAIGQATGQPVPPELLDAVHRQRRERNAPRTGEELAPHTRIADRYSVLGWLGRGNCATVHKVEDLHTGEELALKWLLPDPAIVDAEAQLHVEYAIGAQIDHPNVLRAHEEGEAEGRRFIVLELLHGTSLEDHLDTWGAPPAALAVPLLLGAARGLAAAHALGVVHRDVKPGNLFLDETTAQLKLIDFGVALAPGISPPDAEGTVLGTPAYVSPEQLRGVTHGTSASDVFALGVVFYEVLTGRRPFRGQTVQQLLGRIAKAPPVAPRKLNPDVPRALSDLVLRMLSKEPDPRPTAAAITALLDEVTAGGGPESDDLSGSQGVPTGSPDAAQVTASLFADWSVEDDEDPPTS